MDKNPPSILKNSIFYFLWIFLTLGIPSYLIMSLKDSGMAGLFIGTFLFFYLVFLVILQIVMIFLLAKYHYGKPSALIYAMFFLLIIIPIAVFTLHDIQDKKGRALFLQQRAENCKQERLKQEKFVDSEFINKASTGDEYNDGEISFMVPKGFVSVVGSTPPILNVQSKERFSNMPEQKIRRLVILYKDGVLVTINKRTTEMSVNNSPILVDKNTTSAKIYKINNAFVRSDNKYSFEVSLSFDGFDKSNYITFLVSDSCSDGSPKTSSTDDKTNILEQIKQSIKLIEKE